MKLLPCILILFALLCNLNSYCQVGINLDGSLPNNSAILDVKSNSKGLLVPRMTAYEISILQNPSDGLLVYNTDNHRFYFFDSGIGEWKEIAITSNAIVVLSPVTNPTTGKTWMDRNLGASQVALHKYDSNAYGYLFQWGRYKEGHQISGSSITTTRASTPTPNTGGSWDGKFICTPGIPEPADWLTSSNNNLWQGLNGINNPCPNGFRIPTESEWQAERQSWSTNNSDGAFNSVLKLTVAGQRNRVTAEVGGDYGRYWTSTIDGGYVKILNFDATTANIINYDRAYGMSVRCIQN